MREIVLYLIEAGARLNEIRHGNSPLGIAARANHPDIVKILREHGATANP